MIIFVFVFEMYWEIRIVGFFFSLSLHSAKCFFFHSKWTVHFTEFHWWHMLLVYRWRDVRGSVSVNFFSFVLRQNISYGLHMFCTRSVETHCTHFKQCRWNDMRSQTCNSLPSSRLNPIQNRMVYWFICFAFKSVSHQILLNMPAEIEFR